MSKTAKELFQDARRELNCKAAQARIALSGELDGLDEIGAEEDIPASIRQILIKYGGEMPLNILSRTFSDVGKLSAARKELREGVAADTEKGIAARPPETTEFKDKDDKTKIIIRLLKHSTAKVTSPAATPSEADT